MAWIYLAASADSHSPWLPGCDQLPIVKTTNTLKLSCFPEWRKDIYPLPQSGMMSPPSEGNTSQQLTLFTEDFHAKTLASQELEGAWKESEADFFSRSCAWPKSSSPSFYFLKTFRRSEPADSTELGRNWPASGMIVGGVLYPLKRLAPTTNETDGGCLLPTPTACDYGTGGNGVRKGKQRQIISLGTMARHNLWPTPRASDGEKGGPNQRGSKGDLALSGAVGGTLNPTLLQRKVEPVEPKDIEIKQRDKSCFKTWALLLKSPNTGRMGIGVKQENAMGSSTLYAWMNRKQAERLYEWLGQYLGKKSRKTPSSLEK